jgi:hypothetical protein
MEEAQQLFFESLAKGGTCDAAEVSILLIDWKYTFDFQGIKNKINSPGGKRLP